MAEGFAKGLASIFGSVCAAAHEWGQGKIRWFQGFDEGMNYAKAAGKPLMLVVHRERCPACNHLDRRFASSEELAKLAEDFVMVQCDSYDAPDENGFLPDGGYLPRILFYDASGKPMPTVRSNPRGKYVYAYTGEAEVLKSMRLAKEEIKRAGELDGGAASGRRSRRRGW